MTTRAGAALGLLVVPLLLAAPAWARYTPPPAEPEPLWEAGVAGGVASVAKYAGSSRRDVYVAGFPYLVYRGPWLRVSGRSAHLVLAETPRYWLDLSGGGWLPVSAGSDTARAGMPDLDLTLQAGPRINYLAGSTRRSDTVLRLTARAVWSAAAFNDVSHRGYVAEPAVRLALWPWGREGRFSLSTTVSADAGDSEVNGYFYDVDPAYATPTRPAFSSGGGLNAYNASFSASWRITPAVRVGVYVRGTTLNGTVVADSPLVQSERTYAFGAGFNWIFWRSERKVVLPAAQED
jgi:outer membrane protein